MGNYRSQPATDIENEQGDGPFYKFAAASMQGWRINQEDAHSCLPTFDEEKGISMFAVFDGHGGLEIARYCAANLPDHIKNDLAYKTGDLKEALEEAFMSFDKSLRTPEVIKKLKEILRNTTGDGDDSEYEPEDINGLMEDACSPLEKVLQNYVTEKLKVHGKFVNGTSEEGEAAGGSSKSAEGGSSKSAEGGSSKSTEEGSSKSAEGGSIGPAGDGPAGGSSSAGGSGSGAGGSGTSPGRPARGERKIAEPKEGEADVDKASTDESTDEEDETFDSEDEEGTSGSDGSEGSDSDEDEEDEDEEMEQGGSPGHQWLLSYLKRKRMEALSSSDEEEADEDGPPKRKKPVLTGLNGTPGIESGTTAVVALLGKEKVTVANIGDSRAILGRITKDADGNDKIRAVELSKDHKPELPEEKERIENAGGEVDDDGRVDGGLNLSRAFGDFVFKANKELPADKQEVIAFPDVISADLKFGDNEEDKFLFVACDGIWNDMTSDEVATFVWDRLVCEVPLNNILEQMFKEILAPNLSGDGTGCDNMTAVLVRFNEKGEAKKLGEKESSNGDSAVDKSDSKKEEVEAK